MSDMFGRMADEARLKAGQDAFEDFWKHWPDKRNKEAARKAWKKLRPADREMAAERVEAWCRKWRADNPQASHIHCATYLNQKRFLDEDEKQKQSEDDYDAVLRLKASCIRDGRGFLARGTPSSQVAEMVGRGLLTPEEASRFWEKER